MDIQTLYNIYEKHQFVYSDSRIDGQKGIFFALKGKNFDGNKYAEIALKTASYAVVDDASVVKDERYILVENCLKTLQNLAELHRTKLDIPLIGITGTNGKTTTKELIAAVLSKKSNTFSTQGNLNNHIGVPLSILKITKEHEIAVIEMGASEIGDIELLCQIAKPNYGIITNIGRAHIETFGSFENVIVAKSKLYRYLRENRGIAFINNDDRVLEDLVPPKKTISYGFSPFTHIQGFLLEESQLFVDFYWISSSNDMEENKNLDWIRKNRIVQTKLVGKHNLQNALAATAVGIYFGVEDKLIKEALEEYTPENNRSQYKKTPNNELIIDCYNANPSSMKTAITNFAGMALPNKVLILGDMYELGADTTMEHDIIANLVIKYTFNSVFLIGENFYSLGDCKGTLYKFRNVNEFIVYIKEKPLKDCVILVKGSRVMKLENILGYL